VNIERVIVENFRSHPESDLSIPLGATAVIGVNGAGKSSLIAAIDYALFAGRGEGARYLRRGATRMLVSVTVEHRGERYSIARGYSASGGGRPSLEFFRDMGDNAEQLTLESIDATSDRIVRTLGVNRETMRASSVLMQGDSGAWTEADPADRKRVLSTILGLDVWPRLALLARADLQHAAEAEAREVVNDRRRAELEVELAAIVEQRVELDQRAEDAGADVSRAEATLAVARTRLEEARGVAEARRDYDARVNAARNAVERLTDARHRLAEHDRLAASIAEHTTNADDLPELEASLTDARNYAEAWRVAERAQADANREADSATRAEQAAGVELDRLSTRLRQMVDAPSPTCPTCAQALDLSARLVAETTLRAEADAQALAVSSATAAMEAAIRAADECDKFLADHAEPDPDAFADLELRIAAARRAEAGREQAREYESLRETLAGGVARADAEHAAAEAAIGPAPPELSTSLGEHELAVQTAERELGRLAGAEREAGEQAARLVGRFEALTEQHAEVEGAPAALEAARLDVGLYTRLQDAYGRDGVPAVVVDQQAVPAIEANANGVLEQLGVGMRVELRTQRATKQGNVRETLDIIVHAAGGESVYGDFSGGEKTRLNVALRIALAILLSNRRGADVRTLIVDEPEYLDVDGHERLAELLRSLSVERFDRVLLISHEAAMLDALDQSIIIAKDAHGDSRIEGA